MSLHSTVKRIAVLGPESTGKTTVCMQLAEHFQTNWVPEFARNYISTLQKPYTQDDILYCAQQQLKMENEKATSAMPFLFCDTDFIVAKVWSMDVFGQCPQWILDNAKQHRYDLYLLMAPDIPFENDPIRENPHRREELFEMYRQELENYKFPYKVISGVGKKRFQEAVKAIDSLA
jgi:NadR type nicotinamide-nucleotide adenylyltransferase